MHNIDLDDFKEEFPRMPAEANPLDNNIANPDLLDNEQGLLHTHLFTYSRTYFFTCRPQEHWPFNQMQQ